MPERIGPKMPERMMTTVVVFGGTGFLGLVATS